MLYSTEFFQLCLGLFQFRSDHHLAKKFSNCQIKSCFNGTIDRFSFRNASWKFWSHSTICFLLSTGIWVNSASLYVPINFFPPRQKELLVETRVKRTRFLHSDPWILFPVCKAPYQQQCVQVSAFMVLRQPAVMWWNISCKEYDSFVALYGDFNWWSRKNLIWDIRYCI